MTTTIDFDPYFLDEVTSPTVRRWHGLVNARRNGYNRFRVPNAPAIQTPCSRFRGVYVAPEKKDKRALLYGPMPTHQELGTVRQYGNYGNG